MSLRPHTSVVIATRNRRALLEEAIASVRSQDREDCEMVVVDDASTDDTASYLASLSGVRALSVPHHGERSRARNLGLAAVQGQYVMFLDDDDLLKPGALSVLSSALDRYPQAVAAVGAREDWIVAEGYRGRDAHPMREEVRPIFDELMFGWSSSSGQNLYRTRLVRTLRGYAPELNFAEDRYLWLRVARRGPVVLCPETVMTYRVLPEQYRPPNMRRLREQVARRIIRGLPKGERRAALRLRRCRAWVDGAEDDAAAGRLLEALRKVAVATALAPALMLSPMIATSVLRRVAGQAFRGHINRGDMRSSRG